MGRTSASEVKAIMDNCTVADATVEDPFIVAANALVTKVYEDDDVMTDDLKEQIECWLAAHMLAVSLHRSTKKEKLGDANVEYTGQFGKKLESTSYGQMVLTLDITGRMAELGEKRVTMYAIPQYDEDD